MWTFWCAATARQATMMGSCRIDEDAAAPPADQVLGDEDGRGDGIKEGQKKSLLFLFQFFLRSIHNTF
jgi:hypothetical protein